MSVTLQCKFRRMAESGRAILVEYGSETTWLPVSQIEDASMPYPDMRTGTAVELTLSDWIAKQKNITAEEFYEARPDGQAGTACPWFVQDNRTGRRLCSASERDATIIAAALNMTEGKI